MIAFMSNEEFGDEYMGCRVVYVSNYTAWPTLSLGSFLYRPPLGSNVRSGNRHWIPFYRSLFGNEQATEQQPEGNESFSPAFDLRTAPANQLGRKTRTK